MEFITNSINTINWWAVVVATISTMPVGYVWYDLKIGFGTRWAKLNHLNEKELGSSDGMVPTFAIMLAVSFITAFLMACFIKTTNVEGFLDSLIFGLLFGVVLRGGAHFRHNGFTIQPLELTLIDVGHDMLSLTVMALILGLWK